MIKNFDEYNYLLKESSDKLIRVMNKLLKEGCIIASFQREIDNTKKQKKERFQQLKKFVRENGYGYIQVYGRYVYQEDFGTHKKGDTSDEFSVIIPMKRTNGDEPTQVEFEEFGKKLCEVGEQESILLSYGDMYWWEDENGKTRAELDNIGIAKVYSEFYTRIKKGAKKKENNSENAYGFKLDVMSKFDSNGGILEKLCVIGNSNYAMVANCRQNGDIRIPHMIGLDESYSMCDFDIISEKFIVDCNIRKNIFGCL